MAGITGIRVGIRAANQHTTLLPRSACDAGRCFADIELAWGRLTMAAHCRRRCSGDGAESATMERGAQFHGVLVAGTRGACALLARHVRHCTLDGFTVVPSLLQCV